VRTGGLKSGPFAAGAIYYYRIAFTVKCFLEIHRWSFLSRRLTKLYVRQRKSKFTLTAALLADEESDEAEAEFPDRLLPSLIRCW
jgi:hypothetical protein